MSARATAEAIAAGRQVLDPSQQLVPDDLTAALEAACESCERGEPESAADALRAALDLARHLGYF